MLSSMMHRYDYDNGEYEIQYFKKFKVNQKHEFCRVKLFNLQYKSQ